MNICAVATLLKKQNIKNIVESFVNDNLIAFLSFIIHPQSWPQMELKLRWPFRVVSNWGNIKNIKNIGPLYPSMDQPLDMDWLQSDGT